jgi:phosphoserine phosphatase
VTTLSARDLEPILAVAGKLAAPFDLTTMLKEVTEAAKRVLSAARCTVWLYDRATDELVLRLAEDIPPVRISTDTGIAGRCARTRKLINVPDCYADPRFNQHMDQRTGFRTRCMLTLPLVDHLGELVGVMQILNKGEDEVFDDADETLATVLAAQCGVALQRVRMTEAMIEGEKMRQQLEVARVVQMSTLPATMPTVAGYDLFGTFRPADLTGGDTFDLAMFGQDLLVVLGDATGHGIGPALSVTQMHAMLRMAFRLGSSLEDAFIQVNNQLAEILPRDRFITAFIGQLDTTTHRLRFHSGGQAPILHFRAATGECIQHGPTSFPLSVMPIVTLPEPAVSVDLAPGDVLAVISDGVFEHGDPDRRLFGEDRALEVLRAHSGGSMAHLADQLFKAVEAFARGAPPDDDMTVVFVKREGEFRGASRQFERRIDALASVVAFTAEAYSSAGIEPATRHDVDFTLEELFTNMVKYGNCDGSYVTIVLTRVPGGVEAILVEDRVDRFDPTKSREVDTAAPLDARRPGGLGLHLIKRVVDSIDYRYSEEIRQGRTTFRKTVAGRKKE